MAACPGGAESGYARTGRTDDERGNPPGTVAKIRVRYLEAGVECFPGYRTFLAGDTLTGLVQ